MQVVSDPVGYGFVIRGSRPVYVHSVDQNGPAAAAGLKVRPCISSIYSHKQYWCRVCIYEYVYCVPTGTYMKLGYNFQEELCPEINSVVIVFPVVCVGGRVLVLCEWPDCSPSITHRRCSHHSHGNQHCIPCYPSSQRQLIVYVLPTLLGHYFVSCMYYYSVFLLCFSAMAMA